MISSSCKRSLELGFLLVVVACLAALSWSGPTTENKIALPSYNSEKLMSGTRECPRCHRNELIPAKATMFDYSPGQGQVESVLTAMDPRQAEAAKYHKVGSSFWGRSLITE